MARAPDTPAHETPRAGRRAASAVGTLEPQPAGRDPYAAFRFADYRFYSLGNFVSIVGRQMLMVAVEWELYARTHSATALGLVGLIVALPVVVLSLPAGHLADVMSRKTILLWSQAVSAIASVGLAFASANHLVLPPIAPLVFGNRVLHAVAGVFERHAAFHFDDFSVPLVYLLVFITATARTFGWAARSAYFPTLVPRNVFANAVTWNSSVFQIGAVAGPALAGLLIVKAGFPFIYCVDAVCAASFFALVLPIKGAGRGESVERNAWRSLAAAVRFLVHTKVILATITLDMLAVLFGGATALLPIFADQILHCGPIGLGWLRAAPALGAFLLAVVIAYLPPMRRAGRTLLWCVTGFGVATIVFALSRNFWLSLLMMFVAGAFDSVSVIVRHTLLQLLTPDEMRGRMSAANNIFISTSNELGALESGLTAALFGPVLSVLLGGIGTILVVIGVALKWPEARRIGRLDRSLATR